MAQRETREQAQERILVMQAELMERLEKNPKYKELEGVTLQNGHDAQQEVIDTLMPNLFDPKYEISKRLQSIQVCKSLIGFANRFAAQSPENSELCAETIEGNRWCIQQDLLEIKRIQKGDFEWVI